MKEVLLAILIFGIILPIYLRFKYKNLEKGSQEYEYIHNIIYIIELSWGFILIIFLLYFIN